MKILTPSPNDQSVVMAPPRALLLFLFLSFLFERGWVNASFGVDISEPVSSTVASCFAGSSVEHIIPRAFHSTGTVDTNACSTLETAKSAGIQNRDVYMFPCPTCSASASSQVSTLLSYLSSTCSGAWSGKVWLDIEGAQYWLGSYSENQKWYQQLVDACADAPGVSCGIYASQYEWESLFDDPDWEYGSNLPLCKFTLPTRL